MIGPLTVRSRRKIASLALFTIACCALVLAGHLTRDTRSSTLAGLGAGILAGVVIVTIKRRTQLPR